MPTKTRKRSKFRKLTIEDQQVLEKVCKKLAPRFVFPGYESQDICQEAFLIGWSIIHHYEIEKGPLENFLTVSIANGLKNLLRKNRGNEEKRQISEAEQLDVNLPVEYTCEIELQEILEKIDDNLSIPMREDYLRMKSGTYISKPRRMQIVGEIKEILKDTLDLEEISNVDKINELISSPLDNLISISNLQQLTNETVSLLTNKLTGHTREYFLKYRAGVKITKEQEDWLLSDINYLLNIV